MAPGPEYTRHKGTIRGGGGGGAAVAMRFNLAAMIGPVLVALAATGPAQAAPQRGHASVRHDDRMAVRLNASLGSHLPEVRAKIAHSPWLREAASARFALTLVGGDDPRLQLTKAGSGRGKAPIDFGFFHSTDVWMKGLESLAIAETLVARSAGRGGVSVCFAGGTRPHGQAPCALDLTLDPFAPIAEIASIPHRTVRIEIDPPIEREWERQERRTITATTTWTMPDPVVTVTNTSRTRRYVRVFSVNLENGSWHEGLLINRGKAVADVRLRPGQSVQGHFERLDMHDFSRGGHVLALTVSSAWPIPHLADLVPGPLSSMPISCNVATPCYPVLLNPDEARTWTVSARAMQLDRSHLRPTHRATGGRAAGLSDVPWTVQIYSTRKYTLAEIARDAIEQRRVSRYLWAKTEANRQFACGGSIIAENIVLTAAHCVASKPFLDTDKTNVLTWRRVRAGTRLLAKGGTTFAVDAVAVPAEYGAEGKGYDIALLHIAADDQTDRTVVMPAPATMVGTDVDIPADADVRLYGWGTTGIQDDTTKALDVKGHIAHTADYLQVGAEKAIPVAACKAVDQDLAAGMICTRSADPAAHTASCYGDSGGPLVTSDVDGDVLVGVVKGSMVGCGLPGIPDEFTAVSPYRDWIARAMGALKPATAPGVPADARIVRVPFAVPGAATAR